MNVVDSSGWLEYFADGPNADEFAGPIEAISELVVPTLSIFEVFKRVMAQCSEDEALQAVAAMQQGVVVELDTTLAIEAARLSTTHRLPLADSIILATARGRDSILWTQDADFEGLEQVRYFPRRP